MGQEAIGTTIQSGTASWDRKILQAALALFVGVGLIYLAFLKPGIWGFDGIDMLSVAQSLVTDQDFTISPGVGVEGADGQYYSMRYPLLPIVATPFVAIGLTLAQWLNLPAQYASAVCALVTCILLTALTASLVALIALRLGSTARGAYLAALSFAFGSTALVYAREFFAEPLLSFLTALSLYLALGKSNREHAGASILAGLVITAKPAGIVVGPVLSAYFLVKKYPLRTVVGPLIGTGAGVMLYLAYNYMRFGNFFSSGQNTSRFQLEGTLERLIGLLISPGAGGGLFWYCPPVILAVVGLYKLFKTRPPEALCVTGIFLGYWILHSFWRFAGWNWGPRFLIPALPVLFAAVGLIEPKWWKWLIILTVIGFFFNAPTLVSYYQRYYAEASDGGYLEQALALWGSPTDAPLFNGWGAAYRQIQAAMSTNVADILSQAGAPPDSGNLASAELARIVAVWWWVLPAAGIPIWVGFALALMLMVAGIWVLRQGWLLVRSLG